MYDIKQDNLMLKLTQHYVSHNSVANIQFTIVEE
jgi:hypothetical protein